MAAEKILRPELQEALDGLHGLGFEHIRLTGASWDGHLDAIHGEVYFDDSETSSDPERRWIAQLSTSGVVRRCMSLANALVAMQEMFDLKRQQDRDQDEATARRRAERAEADEKWRERVAVADESWRERVAATP